MDFYVTISSGPSLDFSEKQALWTEFNLKRPISLDGEYHVALVQSVFEDIYPSSIATINILPNSHNIEMFSFKMDANDGEDAKTIIDNLNKKITDSFEDNRKPKVEFNEETLEFKLDLPDGWICFLTDVDKLHLVETVESHKFLRKQFNQIRHFYVLSSLVEDQITGSEFYPLLTNICLEDVKSNFHVHVPNSPRYIKVKDNFIESFSLEYTSDINLNTQLPGKITSTLHFKKINGF